MRIFSRILALCLLLSVLLSFASCDVTGVLGGGFLDGVFEPNQIEEVLKDEFENTYREQLNANEAAIYDAVAAAEPGENVFDVTLPDALEICKGRVPTDEEKAASLERVSFWAVNALYAVWLDCPSLFWLETGNFKHSYAIEAGDDAVYRIKTVKITVEKRANADAAAACFSALEAHLSSLSLERGSEVETVRAINDYLCELIEYKTDAANRQSIYGALIEKECVCEGYAHAFKLLCDKYGIACVSIVGTGHTDEGSEAHMWNAVRLNGAWYAVDTTWNDQPEEASRNAFLLVGAETESFGRTYAQSHMATYTRGTSKIFASPVLAENAYR